MLTEQRYEEILKLIEEKKSVTVAEICELLHISESTARRDINALDQSGRLVRVVGGAVASDMTFESREPTVEQIARELGIRREEVVFAMDAMADPVSLYEPLYDSGGDALRIMDQIGDENSTDACWLQQLALKDAISRLTPRQRDILALRYSEGKTQMEVSREIGISQAQVSRLEKGAISEIKKNI